MGVRFLPLAKKMGNPKIFWISNIYLEIQHLPTAPRAFFESLPQNTAISIEIEPLVLDMQCCYSH